MATWKRILTTDDAVTNTNLGTTDLTSADAARVFKLASGTAILGFQDNSGNNILSLATVSGGTHDARIYGGLSIYADAASNQGSLKLFDASPGSNYVALKASSSATADYTLTFPTAGPGGTKILQSNSSGVLSWIDTPSSGSGVTINNNTNNYVLTASGTANTINGEANLTWSGSRLDVTGAIQFGGDADIRHGVLFDGKDSGKYQTTAGISAGDIIGIPKTASITAFRVYTIGGSTGYAELIDASASSTNIDKLALICAKTATAGRDFYVRGMLTVPVSDVEGTYTNAAGDRLFLSTSTAGKLSLTAPSSGYQRVMGYMITVCTISSNSYYVIWFDPSPEYIRL